MRRRGCVATTLALLIVVPGCGSRATTNSSPTSQLPATGSVSPSEGTLPSGRIAFEVEVGFDGVISKNIYSVRPDGGGAQQLTHLAAGYAYHPAYSPDGSRIIFAQEDRGRTRWGGPTSHLHVMDADGAQTGRLTSGREYDTAPATSADGTWVAFVRQIGEDRSAIFLMHPDGTAIDQLTQPPKPESDNFPSFSPDGTSVAFDRGGAIYVASLSDPEKPRRITPSGVDAQYARWSPDGRRLLFEADGLHVINADGSGLTDIGPGGGGDWSPDGNWIAYQRWTPGTNYLALVVARADGSNPSEVWTTPPGTDTFIVYVDWGPGT
jgi:Tol biopolymer transport system component